VGEPGVIPASSNDTASADPQVSIDEINDLTAKDYRIEFDGTDFTVKALPDGTAQTVQPGDTEIIDGLDITLPGAADVQEGDSWLIQPTRSGAADIELAITDPAAIAAGEPGSGSANGENALKLAGLQSKKLLGGGA